MVMHAPWSRSFLVEDPESGLASPTGAIRLSQIDLKEFQLEAKLRYVGEQTGLEGKVSESVLADIRVVGPATLPVTDLASVPQPLRWLVAQYGSHTPAALIHDRLIGLETPINGLTEPHVDRYFRFMLHDLGVRWLRRWLMWAAVAMRTRWKAGGIRSASVLIWAVASAVGMTFAVIALTTQNWPLLLLTVSAPFIFAILWWRQYGAGLVAAVAAPWVLPPTIIGAIGFVIYAGLERVAGVFVDKDVAPIEPLRYESF